MSPSNPARNWFASKFSRKGKNTNDAQSASNTKPMSTLLGVSDDLPKGENSYLAWKDMWKSVL